MQKLTLSGRTSSLIVWPRLRVITLMLALASSLGCTSRAQYEAIQRSQLQECEKLLIPQQAACKSRYQTGYDEYRRELDRIEIEQRTSN